MYEWVWKIAEVIGIVLVEVVGEIGRSFPTVDQLAVISGMPAADSKPYEWVFVENFSQNGSYSRKTGIDNTQCWLQQTPTGPKCIRVSKIYMVPVVEPNHSLERNCANSVFQC